LCEGFGGVSLELTLFLFFVFFCSFIFFEYIVFFISPAVALQSSAKETKSNLPDGWEELFDEAEGQAYYFNEATGETVWDIEEALKLNE
jgi:hypothetical protein